MAEAIRSSRPVSIGTRVAAVLAVPLAPVIGLLVAHLVYHPPRQRRRRAPSAFGLDPSELWITGSSAKGRLHAWHLPGDPQRVVVLGHGMGLEKSRSLAQGQLLHRAGYTVVLFDHVRTMPEHARARIALWGLSFSTFPVLDTLARLEGAVQAVICDSGPTRDLLVIVNSLPRSGLLPVPKALQAAPARTLWQAVYQRLAMAILDPPAEWPPTAQQGSATPVLFVVGDRDAVVPVAQVRAVARRYPRAEVLVVPGAGHLRAIKVDKDAYTATVLDFLARALTKPVAVAQHKGR
jgi:uncharacterized protein